MRKFFAVILVIIFILIATPIAITSSLLETILRPTFLTKENVIDVAYKTSIEKIEDELSRGNFTLYPGLNKEETMIIVGHFITKDLTIAITTTIREYLEKLNTPFQAKLPPITFDLSTFKENILKNPPPNIPLDTVRYAVREIPNEPTINIPLEKNQAEIISTLLAWRIQIQLVLWVLLLIPIISIILLLRKKLMALCLILGIGNSISALSTGLIVTKLENIISEQLNVLQLTFAHPLLTILIKHFYLKTSIFAVIGVILLILATLAYNKEQKNKPKKTPKPKKKIEGILRKGSDKRKR